MMDDKFNLWYSQTAFSFNRSMLIMVAAETSEIYTDSKTKTICVGGFCDGLKLVYCVVCVVISVLLAPDRLELEAIKELEAASHGLQVTKSSSILVVWCLSTLVAPPCVKLEFWFSLCSILFVPACYRASLLFLLLLLNLKNLWYKNIPSQHSASNYNPLSKRVGTLCKK